MKRAPFRRAQTAMQLFPFLAVLICTMGSLIVLLVLVLQNARVQAASAPAALPPAPLVTQPPVPTLPAEEREAAETVLKKLREQKEDLDWQRELFAKQRSEQAEELSKARLELSHLEEHIRRLQEQAKLLTAQMKELERLGENRTEDAAAKRDELTKLLEQLAQAKQDLLDAQEKTKGPRSFAIIPYQGPNGTKRRPIYIECAEDGIIIHPENIMLLANDFSGPLGPGNPLDAALRTIREYMQQSGSVQRDGEPYPLLIVRPSGAIAYSMARSAMKSWDDEFGYELIDDETQLRFPPADTDLEKMLVQTVKDARSRQQILAAQMPSRYKEDEPVAFVATPRGGFAPLADPEETSMSFGTGISGGAGRGVGTKNGSGGFGAGTEAGTSDGTGRTTQRGTGGTGATANGSRTGATGMASNNGTANGTGGNSSTGDGANGTSGAAGGSGGTGGVNGMSANPGTAGQGQGGLQFAKKSSSSGSGGSGSSSQNAAQSSASGSSATSLARTKGADWALPNKAPQSTGITRPIRVQFHPDRLIILPERGDGQRAKTIMFKDGSVRGSVEEFVSTTWKRMEGWGLAVVGGYWKPILKIEVAPDAVNQFGEFETLMRNSGMDIERKDMVRPATTATRPATTPSPTTSPAKSPPASNSPVPQSPSRTSLRSSVS